MFRVGCGLRVSMGLVRRVVWLRLGWGWVILGLGGIIWFRLGRIVRFWSWFGMWLIILGLGFRVGWIVNRSGLRIRWVINWRLRLGVMHGFRLGVIYGFRLGVIYFRKRFRLR